MYRADGSYALSFVSFFDGLKSIVTEYFEPMALSESTSSVAMKMDEINRYRILRADGPIGKYK